MEYNLCNGFFGYEVGDNINQLLSNFDISRVVLLLIYVNSALVGLGLPSLKNSITLISPLWFYLYR
jgi:hypothetical protein